MRAEPSGCLPGRPAVSLARTGPPVPSTPRYAVGAGGGAGAGGQLAAEGLGGALHRLGAHAHAGQLVEQAAGLREADEGGGRAGQAGHARGPIGARHAQRPVAWEEALAAGGAVGVGALEGQPAQDGLAGLGAPSGVARRLAAGTG